MANSWLALFFYEFCTFFAVGSLNLTSCWVQVKQTSTKQNMFIYIYYSYICLIAIHGRWIKCFVFFFAGYVIFWPYTIFSSHFSSPTQDSSAIIVITPTIKPSIGWHIHNILNWDSIFITAKGQSAGARPHFILFAAAGQSIIEAKKQSSSWAARSRHICHV